MSVIATASIGMPSVVVLYVANHILFKTDLATFIGIWSLINTIIVGITSPLISYAPNLRMELGKETLEFDKNFFLVSFTTCSIIVLPLELTIMRYFFDLKSYSLYAATLIFSLLSISFNINNALFIAKGSFIRYFYSTSAYCIASTIGLLIVGLWEIGNVPTIFLAFCLGLAIGSINSLFHSVRNFTLYGFRSFLLKAWRLNSFRRLLILVFITSASTFILNGPLILGTRFNTDTVQLITLGAFTNILLTFYSVLNSFTSPVQTELVANFQTQNFRNFRNLYLKSIAFYSFSAFIVTILLTFTIGSLTKYYVDSSTEISTTPRFLFIVGFGFSAITALPRIGLMIANRYSALFIIWLIGISAFVFSLLIASSSLFSIVVARTISSALILIFCLITFNKQLKRYLIDCTIN